MRIGISGGTFDPIHYGHLIMAETIREVYKLDKVLFIPSGEPPHKKDRTISPGECRLEMVKTATAGNPFFEVSSLEMDRSGYSYTVDTLKALCEIYGEETRFFFIIGADMLYDLKNWRNAPEVINMCKFIAVLRPGFNKAPFEKEAERLNTQYGADISCVEVPLIDISSTFIREKTAGGQSIRYLVPEEVERYIMENRLYV